MVDHILLHKYVKCLDEYLSSCAPCQHSLLLNYISIPCLELYCLRKHSSEHHSPNCYDIIVDYCIASFRDKKSHFFLVISSSCR
jgi:hypothetical protein